MSTLKNLSLVIFSTAMVFGIACAQKEKAQSFKDVKGEIIGELGLMGEVKFSQVADGVEMKLDVRGLPKGKTLAAHIHEVPKCDKPGFTSAGSHFNPTKVPHGQPDSSTHHVGDLGNQEVNSKGTLQATKVYSALSLDPSSEAYIGNRAFIIHEKADDFSQPVGNAGGRRACAILTQ